MERLPGADLLLDLDVLDVALCVPEGDRALVGEVAPLPGRGLRGAAATRRARSSEPRADEQAAATMATPATRPASRRYRFIVSWFSSLDVIGMPPIPLFPHGLRRRRSSTCGRGAVRSNAEWRRSRGQAPATSSRRRYGAGPVEPRTMSRVSSRRCSGLAWSRRWTTDRSKADRLFALATDRLVDRRERRVHVLGEVDVVEADDADVARDGQAHVAQGAHRTDRHRVAHGQHGGRTDAVLPGAVEGGHAALDAGRADDARARPGSRRRSRRTPRGSRAAAGRRRRPARSRWPVPAARRR